MGILEYSERVHEMLELSKLLPPPIKNNEEYHEDDWDTRNTPYKEDTILNEIYKIRPELIQ